MIYKSLIKAQFPQWAHLSIMPVKEHGHDNYSFRLGEEMLIRLPSHSDYAQSVKKERDWLPYLARHLSLQIPSPIALGKPTTEFPLPWSVYQWIDGEVLDPASITDMNKFAVDLAGFIVSLHQVDTKNGPPPNQENFYRGGDLSVYSDQTYQAIALLKEKIDTDKATQIWEQALSSKWQHSPVWVHGDMSMGNILVKKGQLNAVIDFGQMCIGDPACDLVPYWTFLSDESANIFKQALSLDPQVWQRARGWALWKFLLVVSGMSDWRRFEGVYAWQILEGVLING